MNTVYKNKRLRQFMKKILRFGWRAINYFRRKLRHPLTNSDPNQRIDWRPQQATGPLPAGLTPNYGKACNFDLTPEAIEAESKSPRFATLEQFFRSFPPNSLLSDTSRALLYHLVLAKRPERLLEIGTYQAGTSQVLATALNRVGSGTLYTIDPFGRDICPPIIRGWPQALQQQVRFYPFDSGIFFDKVIHDGITFDMIFIDGNHEVEYAAFDLACSARVIERGGLVVLDNVSQPGPRHATLQFMRANPEWRPLHTLDNGFPGTDFFLIQAPASFIVGDVPRSFGSLKYEPGGEVHSIELEIEGEAEGTIVLTVYGRAFGYEGLPEEVSRSQNFPVRAGARPVILRLDQPLACVTARDAIRIFEIEIILAYAPTRQSERLHLRSAPRAAPAERM
jgi:predicted O-methyltransferase YrrM